MKTTFKKYIQIWSELSEIHLDLSAPHTPKEYYSINCFNPTFEISDINIFEITTLIDNDSLLIFEKNIEFLASKDELVLRFSSFKYLEYYVYKYLDFKEYDLEIALRSGDIKEINKD